MAEEIVNVGYLRDPETKEIFLPQTDESLVTGLTNKIDTAINNKINSLDGNATTTDTGTGANVITEVSETDGILSSKQKTITEGSKIDVTGASGNITIAHESITTTPTDNSSTVGEKETYVITDVTTDGYGHVTAYTKDKSTNLIAADIKAPVKMTDNSMWNFRKTGGSISIGEDSARFTSLKGKTLAWNQLVNQGSPKSFTGANGSYIRDGAFGTFKLISGHKYYCSISGPSTPDLRGLISTDVYVYTTTHLGSKKWIDTANASGTAAIWTYEVSGTSYTDVVANVFDLTLMFGAGNEPSTVAEFEKLFPAPYYSYNKGTLLSITADGIKSVGFNQWDEEWVVEQARVKTKNYIPVIPGSSYYLKIGNLSSGSQFTTYLYDNNKNFVQTIYPYASNTITIPSGVSYMYMLFPQAYGGTYNHDICINLSDTNRNGQYEPYKRNVLDLHLDNIQVKSHNIWDEEWVANEKYADGSVTPVSEYYRIRTKNPIPVKPSTTYYAKVGGNGYIYPRCMDENGNYLGNSTPAEIKNSTFTTLPGTKYIVFHTYDYGYTYNNDICINLSSSFNGQYEPHGILTIEGGLKGARSVYDEIVGNKYIQRVGSVDLGEVTGGYLEVGKLLIGISDMKADYHAGLICSHYKTDSIANQKDKSVASRAGGGIAIYDSSCSTLEQYLSALDNVKANYELATPIEYELAEPIPNTYAVDDNGTEMLIPTGVDVNGVPLSAPFVGEFEYMSNFKEGVLDLMNRLNAFTPTTEIIPDSATANNTLPTSQAVIDYMRAGGNGVKPVYESGDEVTPTTDVHAGLKTEVGNNSYEYYKVPFSAVTNDPSTGTSQVQIVLNGNFS